MVKICYIFSYTSNDASNKLIFTAMCMLHEHDCIDKFMRNCTCWCKTYTISFSKKKNLHNLISGQNSHPTMTIIMTNPSSRIWIHKLWRRKCHVVGLHFCRKMKLFIHNKRTAERQGQKSTVGFKDIVRLLVARFLVNCVQAASNKFYPHPHPLIHFEKVYAMKIITYSCHNFNQTECN